MSNQLKIYIFRLHTCFRGTLICNDSLSLYSDCHLGLVHTVSQVLSPVHLKFICAISIVESMEVGTYHFTRGPKS